MGVITAHYFRDCLINNYAFRLWAPPDLFLAVRRRRIYTGVENRPLQFELPVSGVSGCADVPGGTTLRHYFERDCRKIGTCALSRARLGT